MAFSVGAFLQGTLLFIIVNKRLKNGSTYKLVKPLLKSIAASLISGGVMFFMLKFFDRWVWLRRPPANLPFEKFVLDTRYTANLLVLTIIVILAGGIVYFLISYLLKSEELANFVGLIKRSLISRKIASVPVKETETVSDLDKG
jgi:hypothetical protein